MVLRYDSKYAAGMARGLWQPEKNKELIRAVRGAVRDTRVTVWWKHVKGHSGHKWNDRADELAEEGAGQVGESRGEERSTGQKERERGEREEGKKRKARSEGAKREVRPEEERTRGVRRLTYRESEVERVMRASTRHGVLNTSARRNRSIKTEELEERRRRCVQEI